ncbi:MAG: uracil-DNA glycosylase [Waddliaceae bacterium]|nr:uracil-DNA glycosylase [Waddliaceae bacterium]MBT3579366.1 uracil-DNA glycosylase [Waddliaceae bacterium]MBT4444856.1 uracil-DNA glycosylase [Waddliaceae bacterium]MBT6928008.1 uracil-DNA glycosylase [Waddliaceae bacterium]MBT7264316.1 uracil-DNA glycosylase [Waddliaceae bacterium]
MIPTNQMDPSWQKVLAKELSEPYIAGLAAFVEKERASGVPIYPTKEFVFNAFKQTPYDAVKVVIVGQDPYHGPGQAHGLCFSVNKGVTIPPSLKNIFKELIADVGISPPYHGSLLSWAQQGILLLNTTLTVRQGSPQSHRGKGWERFTDAVINLLGERQEPIIFVLWGRSAQEKRPLIGKHHTILTAAHPSPFSVQGFLGCRHFSKINEILISYGKDPIDWEIT